VDHFDDFFLPELQLRGYTGDFRAKKDRNDGNAIFWKRAKFASIEKIVTPLVSDKYGAPTSLPTFAFTILLKSLQATPEYEFYITNTHLKAGGPEQDTVRSITPSCCIWLSSPLDSNGASSSPCE